MTPRVRGFAWLLLSLTGLEAALAQTAPASGEALSRRGIAAQIEIQGAIGPATSGYFEKAHRLAVDSGASLIIRNAHRIHDGGRWSSAAARQSTTEIFPAMPGWIVHS